MKRRAFSLAVLAAAAASLAAGALVYGQLRPGLGGAGVLIVHEPMPAGDGLLGASVNDPVFLYDEDPDGEMTLPSGIVRDGVELPQPVASGEDLLYRTAPPAGDPGPGTVHNVQREVSPDEETGREPWLRYHAVFDPAVIPFKRNSARDLVTEQGTLATSDTRLQAIPIAGNHTAPGREVFWGSILVELLPGLSIPIPSVAPSSRILSYETVPEVKLTFYKDGGDNFFVDGGSHAGRIRVNFVMDAPTSWFHRRLDPAARIEDIPPAHRPVLPERFQADVRAVARRIGIGETDGFAQVLGRMVFYFRSFVPGDLPPPRSGESSYRRIALGQRGVCRHRVYAFVVTAHGLRIPARYVSNEAHVFAEVWVPGAEAGWLRVDLGGGAQGMEVRNGGRKTRHAVGETDPFGYPPAFESGYSHRAQSPEDTDAAAGDPLRGLPPTTASRAAQWRARAGGTAGGAGAFATRSPWGAGPPRRPLHETGETPTETILEETAASVFRGEKLVMRGRVTAGGEPIPGGVVRIELMDADREEILLVLGSTVTDSGGRFSASIVVPPDVIPGLWEVVAEFTGDRKHAPSLSR